jgi:hypothetical protein
MLPNEGMIALCPSGFIVCSCGMNLENQIRETRVEFGARTVRVSN